METGNLQIDAQAAFGRELRRRRRGRIAAWLLRRDRECSRLASLDRVIAAPAARREAGLREVPLASIAGTAESAKAEVFDGRFRPPRSSSDRWQRLWMAGRRGIPLPPISVYRLGDRYFVNDGHHRVSVAHSLGMAAIDAEVTELGAARV